MIVTMCVSTELHTPLNTLWCQLWCTYVKLEAPTAVRGPDSSPKAVTISKRA